MGTPGAIKRSRAATSFSAPASVTKDAYMPNPPYPKHAAGHVVDEGGPGASTANGCDVCAEHIESGHWALGGGMPPRSAGSKSRKFDE